MPEGPSIVILKDEAASLAGRRVLRVSGNTRIEKERMVRQVVRGFDSWGKHFLVRFDAFTLRVHFMLWGSWRIDERREGREPRLSLGFARGRELNFYACSVRFIDSPLDDIYDWSADVLSDSWNPRAATRKLRAAPQTLACDALLDQNVFAGVGNIIKNEVLFRIRVHPESQVGALPRAKLAALVREARNYSFDFLAWKRAFVLRKHWLMHTKRTCPRCGGPVSLKHLGRTQRRTFWCPNCQPRYD
ncbi:MAG TPA: DNA-formamidopyrimidine glycosylase family protein [Xanthomonadales bacterium]|nr:DNA-formamidopyrimidine glycosylase family protein [Xanthomonadales bacterium]